MGVILKVKSARIETDQEKSLKNEIGENKVKKIDICDCLYVFLSKQ